MWCGGCIIRSQFLSNIRDVFERNPKLQIVLLDEFFIDTIIEVFAKLEKSNRSSYRNRCAGANIQQRIFIL